MLTVVGAGFPRTGTTSLKAALERLGFGPCFHMWELLAHTDQVDHWLPLASGEAVNWDDLFTGYRSAVDYPASHYWWELAARYPDSKVILTIRDPHRWYTSFRAMVPTEEPERFPPGWETMSRLFPLLQRIGRETFGTFGRNEGFPSEELAVRVFGEHIETVRRSLPADRLLIFEARQGWEPLCDFLGAEVPDEPFPHLNDGGSFPANLERALRHGDIPS
ncbi:sulfotransferase family protein [Spongiactinospora sp. TRM90649]|uniref:sulfotransferase family protein n=1 Tax=Spongiactinospora sp. TRM90649 TaxID=3031114 RepID=UPI0023F9ADE1|nr:sulfotransferase family protein [Spongiactinospora sp. TRM90649]MDF5758258.1 sulfotransferase [Spongiactinospora sp. TRM90649]